MPIVMELNEKLITFSYVISPIEFRSYEND